MKAYDLGFIHGESGNKNDRARVYETQKAENAYWDGYTAGMIAANPGKRIVQCEREGKIFAVADVNDCTCPTCGRRYIDLESDRKLKVLL